MKKRKLLTIALLCGLVGGVNATVIIGGATGNGDFNAGGGGTAGPAQWYSVTDNWFNASGSDGINFTQSSQMGGSTDPNNGTTTRGAMPYHTRVQVNNTSYTVLAGDVGKWFALSYDFGAGGGPAAWNGDEVMNTFLFTTATTVDGNFDATDITSSFGIDAYAIDRANDGQWTTRTVANMHTIGAGDVGKTIYFGMEFDRGAGADLFPRLDTVSLEVIPEPATLGLVGLSGGVLLFIRRKFSI